MKTDKLFLGRIWTCDEYEATNGVYRVVPADNQYRILYLTKHIFVHDEINAFKDVESGKYYPMDEDAIDYEEFLINTKDLKPLKDIFPKGLSDDLSKSQLKVLCSAFNEVNYQNKDNYCVDLINPKVLTRRA